MMGILSLSRKQAPLRAALASLVVVGTCSGALAILKPEYGYSRAPGISEFACAHAAQWQGLARRGRPPITRFGPDSPDDTDVLHYDLNLEARPTTHEIVGTVVMNVRSLVNGLNQFEFRLSDAYAISQLKVNGAPITEAAGQTGLRSRRSVGALSGTVRRLPR